MPLPGLGVAPAAGSIYNELAAVTRRAYVPKLFVQLYFASPALFYMMGNAQRAAGGLNQVTIPAQGASMVQGQWTGYGGGFNSPVITPAIQNLQFNLSYWVVPVPLPFGESIIQSTEAVIPILKARMNDVYAVTRQNMAGLLFTDTSSNPLQPLSLRNAFDNGTNYATYGGVTRTAAGNSNFQGQYISLQNASGFSFGTTGFTRARMASLLQYAGVVAGGEAVDYVVMNPGDFATLNQDFIGVEQTFINPGNEYDMSTAVRSSFPNLNVNGIPIFADPFVPVGNVFGVNNKYTAMYMSEDAALDFSGFYSLVPLGQIGQQGVVVLGYQVISAKPKSGFWAYGLQGAAFTVAVQ